MTRGADILLEEILEAIRLVELYTQGLNFKEFAKDVEKQDAVLRRLEIVGEAVKGLPEELRSRYPDVPSDTESLSRTARSANHRTAAPIRTPWSSDERRQERPVPLRQWQEVQEMSRGTGAF